MVVVEMRGKVVKGFEAARRSVCIGGSKSWVYSILLKGRTRVCLISAVNLGSFEAKPYNVTQIHRVG
jgi:hypothetical protein